MVAFAVEFLVTSLMEAENIDVREALETLYGVLEEEENVLN